MSNRRVYQSLAAAALLAIAPAARAVIVTGSAGGNATAPTGPLANSGWQWQASWQNDVFTVTPIAPEYFITALHVGGSFTGLNLNGVHYEYTNFSDGDPYKQIGDLRLWRVNGEFPSYAPIYNASVDGLETNAGGKNLVVYGRGTDRGNPVTVGTLKGWEWGADNHVLRWGENKVTSFATVNSANDMLKFEFNASGLGYTGVNEAQLSNHDSGGGVFIQVGSEYKLAAVNYGATGTYRTSPGGADIDAAIFDSTGLYNTSNQPLTGPGYSLASRITPALATFTPWLNLPPTWKTNADGVWTTAGSWTTGTVPNAIDARADFRTVIGQNRAVTLNSTQTVGKISLDNVNRYTISGSGAITMDVTTGNATIQLASGNHTIALPITLNDSLNVNVIPAASVLTVSNQITATNQTINKLGAGAVEVKNVRASGLNVSAGTVKVLAGGGTAGTSNVANVTVTGTGKVDLTNHDMVVPYSGASPIGTWNGSAYTSIHGAVSSGFNNGAWDGPGILSSIGSPNGALTGIAVAEASDVLDFSGGPTQLWSGQTVDATTVLLKYTYVGDLDLNGELNGDDYFYLDSHVLQSGSVFGYHNGDIDLNGEINGDDYFWLDSNILAAQANGPIMGGSGAMSASLSAVPEPVSLGILALPAIVLSRRHRRSGARRNRGTGVSPVLAVPTRAGRPCHSGG